MEKWIALKIAGSQQAMLHQGSPERRDADPGVDGAVGSIPSIIHHLLKVRHIVLAQEAWRDLLQRRHHLFHHRRLLILYPFGEELEYLHIFGVRGQSGRAIEMGCSHSQYMVICDERGSATCDRGQISHCPHATIVRGDQTWASTLAQASEQVGLRLPCMLSHAMVHRQ